MQLNAASRRKDATALLKLSSIVGVQNLLSEVVLCQ